MAQTLPLSVQLRADQTGLTLTHRVLNLDESEFAAAATGLAETAVAGEYTLPGGYSAPDAGGYVEVYIQGGALLGTADIDPAAPTVTQIQSGLATQASVDTIDDFLDTEIAAIKAKTDNLPADPADESNLTALLNAIDDFLGTEVAAIKAKTDLIPSDPADASDIAAAITAAQTAITNAIAALNNLSQAQAQTAATAALNAYDPPTFAELDTRTDAIDAAIAAIQIDTNDLQVQIGVAGAGLTALPPATVAEQDIIDALNSYDAATGDDIEALGASASITLINVVSGSTVTVYRNDTWHLTITIAGVVLTDYEAVAFVVKQSGNKTDDQALLYVRSDTDLIRIGGDEPSASNTGSLTVDSATAFTVHVDISETDVMPGQYDWWLKVFEAGATPDEGYTRATGTFIVENYGLRATA